MNIRHSSRVPRAVESLIRGLLAMYPYEHRARFADEMLHVFQEAYADAASRRQRGAITRLLLVTTISLIQGAASEHLAEPARTRKTSGLLLIVGGVLWVGLHTPPGFQMIALPAVALIALFAGTLLNALDPSRTARQQASLITVGIGLLVTFAGYMMAWISGWHQSGMPLLAGSLIQGIGLAVCGTSMRANSATARAGNVLLLAGMVNWLGGLLLALALPGDLLLRSGVVLLTLLGQGIAAGMCWAGIGVTLWRTGAKRTTLDTEVVG